MAHIVPYLLGGLTAFLVMDAAAIQSPTEPLSAARANMSANMSEHPRALGTPASSINRAAKSDRAAVRHSSSSVVRPVPPDAEEQQARDRKPASTRERKVPIGCEPSFSPVAAPSLAHHTGRCMARLEMPWTAAALGG